MCDQTEVTYAPGDVVWVKLGPVWWPGQVQDYDKLPEEITSDLRKRPIAVVKFFQEDTYEYVKNLNHIYQYNCRKKEEFIKKGLDMVRSSNTREVPSNMSMFPNDIVMAEHITGGNPNILESETFAPEQKPDYSEIFGSTKKTLGKKSKGDSLKKEFRRLSDPPVRNGRKNIATLPVTIPRPITHRRFIAKALEGRSDHEVRIRCQISIPKDDDENTENSNEKKYKCHLCDFQSARLNVIVLHNKSHSPSFIEAQNATKAKLKSRERERERVSLGINQLNEQTPSTFSVTSRGRVKSFPKKLLDYSDEPPPKMLKEKTYSKQQVKEETVDSFDKFSVEKTPKKQKDSSEKTTIKRPLFGKRKTAKEKAELAAKLKQENEVMKETLLKDWDEDDVNEEVELERLKQALEATTTVGGETKSNSPVIESESKTNIPEKSAEKEKEQPPTTSMSNNKVDDIKTKVFEFDDSEDSLPVNINFRLKSKQEKFTDDKFKKPSARPPKPLSKPKSKSALSPLPPPPLFNEKKEDDKEKETLELTEAFNALLEETTVPVLPEIPKTGISLTSSPGQFSYQTSDISSSTDLLDVTESIGDSAFDNNKDTAKNNLDSNVTNDFRMECTSSDNEESNKSDQADCNSLGKLEITDNQKNFKGVSVVPSTETDSEVISSGDTTTTNTILSITENENKLLNESFLNEDITMTEITSTCDGTKSCNEEIEANLSEVDRVAAGNSNNEQSEFKVSTADISNDVKEHNITSFESENKSLSEIELSGAIELNSHILSKGDHDEELMKEGDTTDIKNEFDSNLVTEPESIVPMNKSEGFESLQPFVSTVDKSDSIPDNLKRTDNIGSGTVITEEIAKMEQSVDKQCDSKDLKHSEEIEHSVSEHLLSQEVVQDQSKNVQFLLPANSESNKNIENTSQGQNTTLHDPKVDIIESCKVENQTMQQNLQDMELDINSMPVIIGGEDFIQPEQPKQNVVTIKPKYSESIVISPKANAAATTSKSESVIMHLEEPSTSSQKIQSVISIPSKGTRNSGRGGRSQKTASKTIKLSPNTLKNLGALPKGGNQQVLILKTSSNKDNQDKGSLQKSEGPLNLIQHGNKILIVNNPQMTGQNKIKLNPQQQQLLTGGKLAPGTRVFTSKVVATTSLPSNDTNKISVSRTNSKPTQNLVISKGGLLSNTSKSVIINSSTTGKLITVPGTQTINTSKGQTVITQNIIKTKGGIILPGSSVTPSGKTATIITSQSLPSSKGMILTPITSKSGQIISGNQKLRIVSSKAPLSGTKFVVQNPQGKITIDPQQKGQQIKVISGVKSKTAGNTIFFQTSQGLVAKSISSSSVTSGALKTSITSTVAKTVSSIPTQAKIRVTPSTAQQTPIVQQPQTVQPSTVVQHGQIIQPQVPQSSATVKKVTVQKVRQSPNILQRNQRKSTPRASKATGNRLITPATPAVSEPILLSTTSSLPVITQPALVQGQIPQGTEGLLYLTLDESGNYRQLDGKSLIPIEGNPPEGPRTIYIPASSQPQEVRNIFLAIDDSGMTQLLNVGQPVPNTSFPSETPAPAQDILAKALANTQVLQQETIIPDIDVSAALSSSVDSNTLSSSSFTDQSQYPAPSLSHSVQETSLTLTQPIMTPLEVPSSVSPNLGQISSLPSNYITTNLLPKQKHLHPSMPLLTEESLTNQTSGEPVFLLDTSNNIIPATSGSQISFQLTLDPNIVTMSPGSDSSVLPQTYQVVSGDLLSSQLLTTGGTTHGAQKMIQLESIEGSEKKFETNDNLTYSVLPGGEQISTAENQMSQHSEILREALEAPQGSKIENFLNNVEISASGLLSGSNQSGKGEFLDNKPENPVKLDDVDNHSEEVHKSFTDQDVNNDLIMKDPKHSLKRSLAEDHTVTSSSDPQDDSKRIRLEDR